MNPARPHRGFRYTIVVAEGQCHPAYFILIGHDTLRNIQSAPQFHLVGVALAPLRF